jgi:hypothetical protein
VQVVQREQHLAQERAQLALVHAQPARHHVLQAARAQLRLHENNNNKHKDACMDHMWKLNNRLRMDLNEYSIFFLP